MDKQNDLIIKATEKTPFIECIRSTGDVVIKGVCIPEDPLEIFLPIKRWLAEIAETNHAKISVAVDLEYFNTSTSGVILNFFRLLKELGEKGKVVRVVWEYECDDEDIKEAGQDYQDIIGEFIILQAKPSEELSV